MKLTKVRVGAGLGKRMLPNAVGVETFRIKAAVGRRHGVRVVVLVGEGHGLTGRNRQRLGRERIILYKDRRRRRGCCGRGGDQRR